ncbi:Pre-mRNA-splicing factor of RES complex-domain-containing protein [Pseudoneurospora amorphoporcata]|uniref:Pre-mRNA-splicing factor of RES complex-domain-containing protein n=1 Tax=Pseudoneurospora amorphoporcata TaxID=241081 RepID=A0AAN6P0K9_9PEZI|nr:Pre-mRNA-splicing factor of RES complex-domain-containing protein [Pseudoneurospora amorphoporcata]
MPSDKAAYLAAHYLSTDPPNKSSSTKKRKRKTKSTTESGLIIADDDDNTWAQASKRDSDDDNDFDGPILATDVVSADFKKAKTSGWKTVGSGSTAASKSRPTPTQTKTTTKEDLEAAAAADAILAQTAAETAALAREAGGDDEVLVVDTTTGATALTRSHQPSETAAQAPIMSNGTHAGLQSASAITAQLRARQEAERLELERIKAEREQQPEGTQEELVLRDATGRRIDASMRRAEARRQQAEAERKEQEKIRALKGEVQLEQARRRREELEEAKLMPLARGKDDEQLNREMKEQERWNDPMAQFLAPEEVKTIKGKRKGLGRRPVYKGPAPPNRYGIKPGYRWDGVDRSNGFEGERFRAINRRERNKGLEYAWQMDE